MRPTEIELQKINNKLNTLIKFFMKDMYDKEYNQAAMYGSISATKKALAHAERIGWIKGE